MSYVGGNKNDLEVRLHGFPSNTGDLNSFSTEALNYGVAALAPSYTNSGGSGNKSSLVTATSNVSFGGGVIANILNGSFGGDASNAVWFNTNNIINDYIIFDFGSGKLITEAITYFDRVNNNQGTWAWYITNNTGVLTGVTETGFTWGHPSVGTTFILTGLSLNNTEARYYVLSGLAGIGNGNPWFSEIDFKIGKLGSSSLDSSIKYKLNKENNKKALSFGIVQTGNSF